MTNSTSPSSPAEDLVPLDAILRTEELARRSPRPPDYETENRALAALAQALANAPGTILQTLADTILEVFQVGSAGLSLVTRDGSRFYWPAIAGAWRPHAGGGTPRNFGPCGDVLDRGAPLLFTHFERRYPYLQSVTPAAKEALLIPFYVGGKAVGTIWAMAHDDRRQFDAEDLRQLESLGRFAAAAYQAVKRGHGDAARRAALNVMEDAVRARQLAESLTATLRSEIAERERAQEALHESEQHTREQAEQLADLHRRKDEFLAMLSHELRNPLAPIANALHMLRLTKDEEPIQRTARTIIERQVGQITRLVDDLLDVSRITTGRIHLQREPLDLNALVQHAVDAVGPLIERCRHVLEIELPPQPTWLHADATRLEQVLVNLLTNAAKYTEDGGRIWLSLQRAGDEAVLRVRDSGIGISPELLPRIFDLFTQSERALDRSQGGLGIGLSLVHRLVDMHGGRIEVQSTVGEGSEFVVRLPLVPRPTPTNEPSVAEPAGHVASPLRVLVVDDNLDCTETMEMLLKASGNEVRIAHDGPSAIDAAVDFRPDVVLLDVGLPEMSGLEVGKRLRQHPTLGNLVLIAMTGYGQDTDRLRSKEAGFDHHLVKPTDFDELQIILAGIARAAS